MIVVVHFIGRGSYLPHPIRRCTGQVAALPPDWATLW